MCWCPVAPTQGHQWSALQKAAAEKRARDLEEQRDSAVAEVLRLRHSLELAQEQVEEQRQEVLAARTSEPALSSAADVTQQLSALQQQLESLAAEGSSAQLHQERARMSICLRTIKVGTQGTSAWRRLPQTCRAAPNPHGARRAAVGDHGSGAAERQRLAQQQGLAQRRAARRVGSRRSQRRQLRQPGRPVARAARGCERGRGQVRHGRLGRRQTLVRAGATASPRRACVAG